MRRRAVWPLLLLCLALLASPAVRASPSTAGAPTRAQFTGWTQLATPRLTTPYRDGRTTEVLRSVAEAWSSPNLLYAGGLRGLYRSEDGGTSWQPITVPPRQGDTHRMSSDIPTVAVDRQGVVYVGAYYEPIMVTRDGGATWQEGSLSPRGFVRSRVIAPSPAREGLVYAEMHFPSENIWGLRGLVRSEDGGLTWTIRNPGETLALAADPFDPEVVYAVGPVIGRPLLGRSSEGGVTFEPFGGFDEPISALAISPDGSRFWAAGMKGGLYRSLDLGKSWDRVPETPYDGYLVSLSTSPHDPRLLYAVTLGGDLWAYRDPEEGARIDPDYPLPTGHFYTQANGQGGEGGTGFAVTDDGGMSFFLAFRMLPLQAIGYPISQRFTYKGLTTQLFQKLALHSVRGILSVSALNLLDELHDAGKDPWLESVHSIPPREDTSPDAGLPWNEVVARHLAILDRDPALKAAYLSAPRWASGSPAWLDLYGLPTGYGDYPTVSVLRTQRTALQRWKVDVPWAQAGEITIANAGDIAKEAGLFPQEALQPQPPP